MKRAKALAKRALASWERFWFAPFSTSTLAVVRMAFALVVLAFGISLGRDLFAFFGPEGIVTRQPRVPGPAGSGIWGPLGIASSETAVVAVYIVLLVAAFFLLVGFGTRVAAVLVFLGLLAFGRRNPLVFNSGDGLLRVISFYLTLAPCGASFSVDRWLKARRKKQDFWEFPRRAAWPLRLLQVQTSVLYIATVWAKVRGTTWNDGTALSYAFRIEYLERFPLPGFLTASPVTINLLTYGTLAIELSLGILVWKRRLRPWVLGAGVLLHVLIDYRLRVGFFSYGLFVLYLAFLPGATTDRWLLRLRRRPGARLEEPEPFVEEVGVIDEQPSPVTNRPAVQRPVAT